MSKKVTKKVIDRIAQRAIKNRWNQYDVATRLSNKGYTNLFRPNSQKLTTTARRWMKENLIPARTTSDIAKKKIEIFHKERKINPEMDAAWKAKVGQRAITPGNRQPTFEETQRAVAKELKLDKTDPLVNLTLQTKRVDDVLNRTPIGIEKLVDKYNVGSMVKGYENFAATKSALNKELFGSESFMKLMNDLGIFNRGRMAFGSGHQLPVKLTF